ncbi:AAA family ATPase [Leucobacter sp. UT-8R-CII-1-4]|uniref:AAA family ATPase n=1 Tax=Leucobacter sp. UT-8R-CII-1-4 TaxID=3040075 RepID=UPI0024A9D177|nr:AAA family ATPase [Leucobacter sp. UT-8R-CII-1-4]MDI6022725.1 AAA family ATPase [Leucobacter sp. UT-8R-CII-1-4]
MIRTLAFENYRSFQDVTIGLEQLNVITGENGSGKSSLYRALRLLAEVVREGALTSLVAEGGLRNVLHAGDRIGISPVAMRLGFASDELSYAIDLGLPQLPAFRVKNGAEPLDPEVKNETVWHGPVLRPSTIMAQRKSLGVRLLGQSGKLEMSPWRVRESESMLATLASPTETPELFELREAARRWRFYDQLRTDQGAPARRPSPLSFTPVLDAEGANFAGALATVLGVGDEEYFENAVAAAFEGASVELQTDEQGMTRVCMRQPGLRRAITAAELSDGTLRYLLLATALLSPRPPELLVLNEPEGSLHPSLLPGLASMINNASQHMQIIVVTHADPLVRALSDNANLIHLEKSGGASSVRGQMRFDGPAWNWPKR